MVDKITSLREKDMAKIQTLGTRAAESAMHILPRLYGQPIINVALVQQWSGFNTRAGAQNIIDRFVEMNILVPKDKDKKYGQSYVYKRYLDIFSGND